MSPHLIGLILGATMGSIALGLGVSWVIRKISPLADTPSADILALALVAIGGTIVNGQDQNLPVAQSAMIYGIAAMVAYFAIRALRKASDKRAISSLPDAPRTDNAVTRTRRVFHRIGIVLAVLVLLAVAALAAVSGGQGASSFLMLGGLAALGAYLISRAIGWIVAAALGD